MSQTESLFLSAFGLGIAFCAPPGVITAEALRRGLARGFRPALMIELGSLVGDATWAAVALAGAAFLVQNGPIRAAFSVAGVVLLARLAWCALRDAWIGGLPRAWRAAPTGDFVGGAALSLSNPMNVAFWLGVGGGVVGTDVTAPQPVDFAVFFAGFMAAAAAWCFVLAGLVAWGRRFVGAALFRAVNLLCGLALGYFAVDLARAALGAS